MSEELKYRIDSIEKHLGIHRKFLNFSKLLELENTRDKEQLSITGEKLYLDEILPYKQNTNWGVIKGRYYVCDNIKVEVEWDLHDGKIIGDSKNEKYKYYLSEEFVRELKNKIYDRKF